MIFEDANLIALSANAPLLAVQPFFGRTEVYDSLTMALLGRVQAGQCSRGVTDALWFSSSGTRLAIGMLIDGGRDTPFLSAVGVWDLQARTCLTAYDRLEGFIRDVALDGDGGFLLASTSGNDTFLWDAASEHHLCSFIGTSIAFGPTQHVFGLHNYGDNIISLWNAPTCQVLDRLWDVEDDPDDGASLEPGAMGFNPGGDLVAAAPCYTDTVLRIWETRTGSLLTVLEPPEGVSGSFCQFAFSPDGRFLATAVRDPTNFGLDTIVLWEVSH